MNKQLAAQVFSIAVILIMVAVSYWVPPANAAAIFALGAGFLGNAQKHLFEDDSPPPAQPVQQEQK